MSSQHKDIIVIDPSVADWQSLLDDVAATTEVIILDHTRDGLTQIAEALADSSDINTLHIISHGSPGLLQLGNARVDNASLEGYGEQLAAIGKALAEQGDILLYGCNVASGAEGEAFINALAGRTGADIAASDDLTGLGGDWVLEQHVGSIETPTITNEKYMNSLDATIGNWGTSTAAAIGPDTGAIGQSFIATQDGILESVRIADNGRGSGSYTLKIYQGAGTDGALLHTQSGSELPDTYGSSGAGDYTGTTITLSSAVNLTNGSSYTFEFSPGSAIDLAYCSSQSSYHDGTLFLDGLNGGADNSGIDLLFEVKIIDAASSPTVTDSNISITSSGSGTSSAYKIGDTVTVQWDNSAGGDNNAGITGVTADFSAFGGGAAVAASETTPGSNIWTASYTLTSGTVDGTNLNVSITASNGTDTTTADSTNLTVDNQAPTVTDGNLSISGASGTSGAFKVGDTVTATWNNTAGGDNNSDTIADVTFDFSAFGGGSAVSASNSSGTWITTYTITAGAIDGVGLNVSATVTDNAGNTTTTADSSNATVDNNSPTVTDGNLAITTSGSGTGGAFITGDTVTLEWDNSTDSNSDLAGVTADFSAFGGGTAVAMSDVNSDGTLYRASYVITSGTVDATNLNASVTATDNAGNTTTTADTSNLTTDNQAPTVTDGSLTIIGGSGTGGAFIVGDTVTANWDNTNSGDDNGDISSATVDFSAFGGGAAVAASNSSGTWTATYTITEDGGGSIDGTGKNISLTAIDDVGLTATTADTTGASVDNDSPGTPTGTLAVDENSANNTTVGTVSGGGSDGVIYSLTDNASGRFAIDANTGAVTVADGSLLDHESNASHNITVRATDDAGNATDNTLTVTVNDVNEAATLANLNGDSVSFAIGGNPVTLDTSGDAAVADVDSADFDSGNVTVSITTNGQSTEDVLSVGSIGAISLSGSDVVHSDGSGTIIGSVSGGSNGNDLVISLNASATQARVQDLVRALQYTDTDTATTNTAARTVRVTLNDGDGATSAHQDVTINLVRAPIIDLDGDDSSGATDEGFSGSFTEGTPTAAADSDSTISDDGTFKSLTITLTNRPDGAAESLSSTYGSGTQTVNSETVTIGSYDSNTGALTITIDDGSTDASTLQMLMESVRYDNSSDDPNTSDRIITFSAIDNDDNTGSNATATLSITPVNDAPALTTTGSGPTFTEGGIAASLFTGTSIDAIETVDNISSLTLTVTNLADGGDEKLSVDGESITLTNGTSGTTTASSFSYSVVVSGTTATVTLTKDDSTGNWQTLIDTLEYLNSSDSPDTNARIVTLTSITDTGGTDNGGSDSTTLVATSSVTIIPVNSAPTIATNSGPSVQTGRTITITTSHLNEGDPDDDGAELTYTLVSLPSGGALQLNSTDLAVNDTFTQKDIDDGLVTFIAGNTSGATTFEISLADGGEDGAVAASDTVSINVTNPPPPPTPEPEPTPNLIDGATVEENSTTENGQQVAKVTISPITSDREDTDSNTSLADIPLHFDENDEPVTTLSLPVGIGATARSNETATDQTSFRDALYLLRDSAPASDWFSMINGLDQWLNGIGAGWLNQVTFTSNSSEAPSEPIKVSGVEGDKTEVMVIDASQLPAGTIIDLDNIEFAIIVGNVTVRGGSGSNVVFAGSGSQNIVLGEDDDELHGGDGDDTVGSEGGDDLLFGDNGNDTLFGGTGKDQLHGGMDNDIATYEGDFADYLVEQSHGVVTVTRLDDDTDVDTLINIEQIQFADQNWNPVYSTDLSIIATLYQQVLDRQADLGGFQYWSDIADSRSKGQIALEFLTSDEYQQDNSFAFEQLSLAEQIELLYQGLLGRSSDIAGKEYWSEQLTEGMDLSQVAEGFVYSDELNGQLKASNSWDFFL